MLSCHGNNNLVDANLTFAFPCSDGVGRSGVFVCLHSEMDRLRTEHEVDMFRCLKKARTQRCGLVPRLVRLSTSTPVSV